MWFQIICYVKLYFLEVNKGNADSSGEEDSDDEDENPNKSQTETHDLVSNNNLNVICYKRYLQFQSHCLGYA